LSEVNDPSNPRYLAASVNILVHAAGSGPANFKVDVHPDVTSIRVYLSCSPASPFHVRIDGKGFWGECLERFQSFADIPVASGQRNLSLSVPDKARFIVLAISTPS
jgi:hypothetical protein